jgi:hypothetical protein
MRRTPLAALALLIGCSSSDGESTGISDTDPDSVSDSTSDSASVSDSASAKDSSLVADSPVESSADSPADSPADTSAASKKVWGVTTDAVDDVPAIVDSLSHLPHRPMTRIVFDPGPASDYVAAAKSIHAVSDVLGELVDSIDVTTYTADTYEARTTEYLSALGTSVDVWEIGNEINGEWVGTDVTQVVAKMHRAYAKVKAAGGKTALTLYYNAGCYSDAKNEMFTWAAANVPADMKAGLDWVLVSYYEQDCEWLKPDWAAAFDRLAKMFPSSRVGFGECGQDKANPALSTTLAVQKAEYLKRTYAIDLSPALGDRWLGGFFWWYFRQDMVPRSLPMWATLAAAMP